MKAVNRMSMAVNIINRLPVWLRRKLLSGILGAAVPYAGTTRIQILKLDAKSSTIQVTNHRRTRNHIGTVHVVAMVMVAESATGFIVGMNAPDDRMVLLKKMTIDCKRRCEGTITAKAELTDEQVALIRNTQKGDTIVKVTVSDETCHEPIQCEMIWAWTLKRNKQANKHS